MPNGEFDEIYEEELASPVLMEHLVRDNMKDIKSLKRRVYSVEQTSNRHELAIQSSNQMVNNVMSTLDGLKSDLKDNQRDIKQSNEENHKQQLEQLRQYKNTVWAVGATVVGSGAVGILLFLLNL